MAKKVLEKNSVERIEDLLQQERLLEIEKDGSTLEMSKSPLGPPKNVESQNLLRCLQLLLFN